MRLPRILESADELRPHSAFTAIGAVLVIAIGILAHASLRPPTVAAADWTSRELLPAEPYTVEDARGRVLARSIRRLDLVLSPNALWQAHTPERIARTVSKALGGTIPADELRERMLPDAAEEGFVRVREPLLCEEQALRLDRWARRGTLKEDEERAPIDGIWVERVDGGWTLCWDPRVLLSARLRAEHELERSPLTWTRRLADGIARCLLGEAALRPGNTPEKLLEQRDEIWAMLMPTCHHVALRGFDAVHAPEVYRALVAERVHRFQMRIAREDERAYPAGERGLVGCWSWPDETRARAEVLEALDLADREELTRFEQDLFDRVLRQVLAEARPSRGMELAAHRLLGEGPWSDLAEEPAVYLYERQRSRRMARSYFLGYRPADSPPVVRSTIDLALQRQLGRELDSVMEEHDPAIAMAIAIELATGGVLAIDSRQAYPLWGFAPVYHLFTPGSTSKVANMAIALQEGAVTPDTPIEVGTGPLRVYDPGREGRGRYRSISEAEDARDGTLSASDCLAYSSNRGMTRIGLRVPDRTFHRYLDELGYGRPTRTGLGGERRGLLPRLPWTYRYTHASICFGHEIHVSLWQHAAALAAVVRGGEWRPLRLFIGVERGGWAFEVPPEPPRRVFERRVCEQVRAMMVRGAREGTGRHVASLEQLPQIEVGTKTGTAQKTPTEICLHAELLHLAEHQEADDEEGRRCSAACRRTLAGVRPGHSSCYTSSVCAFGRLPGTERELMVLVVVEEPRGTQKFGSKVAGPAAIRILKEALDLTRRGQELVPDAVAGFAPSERRAEPLPELPWAEGAW